MMILSSLNKCRFDNATSLSTAVGVVHHFLSAVVLPSLGRAKNTSKRTVSTSTMCNIKNGLCIHVKSALCRKCGRRVNLPVGYMSVISLSLPPPSPISLMHTCYLPISLGS